MEHLISSMQDQIRLLKKDLKEAHDQISAHQATATPTAALTTTSAVTVTTAHPPPLVPANRLLSLPLNRLLPHLLATSTKDIPRRAHISNHRAGSQTGDLLAASCVGKKGILCPTARPAQSSNACCANKRTLTLAAHLEDEYWSYLQRRMMARNPLTYS